MQEAECEKASMDVKYNMDTKVEDNTRLYKLQKSNFDREINTAVSSFINYSQGRFIILPVNFSAILTFFIYLIIHRISVWWMELIFILFFRWFVGSYVGRTIRKPRRN